MTDLTDHYTTHHGKQFLRKFRNSVRYRLLILTSAPILLTVIFLIACTLYLSFTYVQSSLLKDVASRLAVAENSLTFIEKQLASNVAGIGKSYQLLSLIEQQASEQVINHQLKSTYRNNDYLRFSYLRRHDESPAYGSSFKILSAEKLRQLNPALSDKAKIILSPSTTVESRALTLNTIVPVTNHQGRAIGYLEAGKLINNSSWLVDSIRDLLYDRDTAENDQGTVTLFMDNIRVTTNVFIPQHRHKYLTRAIGTRASDEVYQRVVMAKQRWINFAKVVDTWYIAAYQPLQNAKSETIGMLYTGYPLWPKIQTYLLILLRFSMASMGILMLSGVCVYRASKSLFYPIEHMSRVVTDIQQGENKRVGNMGLNPDYELAQLAFQFDKMLDALDTNSRQLKEFANALEAKVELRTERLKEKQKQLEHHIELLNQTRNKLIAKEKLAALGELTAGIAHEINNPIAVILGNAELLKLQLDEGHSDVDEELSAIFAQIERVKLITSSLLQYSRKADNHAPLSPQDINPIVVESITLVNTGNYKRHIEFRVDLQATLPICVNRHQLLQVLVNLELNAFQSMDGNGLVCITTKDIIRDHHPNGVSIEIQDFGCGISQESINRIFTPFYTTKREGTGLGLSVSQSIVHQMEGEIYVHSEPGHGSIFEIIFPCGSQNLPSI